MLDNTVDYEVRFVSSNKLYKTVRYINDFDSIVNRFMVVLFENKKCSLFKQEHIKFVEKVFSVSSYDKEKPAS
jgi:hypothetical protein